MYYTSMTKLLAGTLTVILAVIVPASSAHAAVRVHKRPRSVYVYGDSLMNQTRTGLAFQLGIEGIQAQVDDYNGTALCDWVPYIEEQVAEDPPDAVAVEFSGNHFTPCSSQATVSEVVAGYQGWLDNLAYFLHEHDVPLLVIGGPPSIPGYDMTAMYARQVAAFRQFRWPDQYLNAGLSVAGAGDQFTWTKPCLNYETPTMGCFGGQIEVRAQDHHHFCRDVVQDSGATMTCGIWDAGAWRYATVIAKEMVNV